MKSPPLQETAVDSFIRTCRARGHKLTPQRLSIYKAITAADDHPTAETVYRLVRKDLPSVSRDTVYRTLGLFQQWGLLKTVLVGSEGLRYDPNLAQHHHFVCDICGVLADFVWDEFDLLKFPAALRSVGAPEQRQAEIHGTCRQCLNKKRG